MHEHCLDLKVDAFVKVFVLCRRMESQK